MNHWRRHINLCAIFIAIMCTSNFALAADQTSTAATNGYPFNIETGVKEAKVAAVTPDASIIKTLGGLALVIGLIFILAKLGKKFHPSISAPDRALKVVSMLSLGSKEKIALIQVGKKQILLGVTTNTINTLLELAEPIEVESSNVGSEKNLLSARTASEFSRKLNEFLLAAGQRNK